jgi:hypothetical protein
MVRLVLCILLCIGATLDDIDYINAIRAPRTMNGLRATPSADDDSDDQHSHFLLVSTAGEIVDLNAPFLSALYAIKPLKPLSQGVLPIRVRSGRAPPAVAA